MKIVTLIIVFFLVVACNNNSQVLNENGIVKDGIYYCDKLEWKIKIPDGYSIRNLEQKIENEKRGYEALKKEAPDGYEIRKNPPHLIGFGIDKKNYFSSSFEPFSGTTISMNEHQKLVANMLYDTYKKIQGIEFEQELSQEKIGKYDFYIIQSKIYNSKTKELVLTQILYNSKINENLFSVSINYTKEDVRFALVENFYESLLN